jgi:hypothetical protein
MPLKEVEPHKRYKCLGFFGYFYGIVVAQNRPRWTGCCECAFIEPCRQLSRSNGSRAFPTQFNDYKGHVEASGYFAALAKMWTQHGCFDPWDSLIIKNEADGLALRKPGYSLERDKDLQLPLIGLGEVLGDG